MKQEPLEGALLELMPSAVLVVDDQGLIAQANTAAEEALGRPVRELLGRHYCDPECGMLAKDGQPLAAEDQPLERLKAQESPQSMRVSSRWPGGTRRRLTLKAERLGQGALMVLEDVTEREEAHRALLRSEERLQMALRSAGLGIWDVDLRKGRVLCNTELTRWSLAASLGQLATMTPFSESRSFNLSLALLKRKKLFINLLKTTAELALLKVCAQSSTYKAVFARPPVWESAVSSIPW